MDDCVVAFETTGMLNYQQPTTDRAGLHCFMNSFSLTAYVACPVHPVDFCFILFHRAHRSSVVSKRPFLRRYAPKYLATSRLGCQKRLSPCSTTETRSASA